MPKILIIEDHENIRNSINLFLNNEGFTTVCACNLTEAKNKISEDTDLILLDWMLPDGQGLDFLTDFRKTKKSIPVIFLTARAETIDVVVGLEAGANDYLTKPFEPRELLARIRVQLRKDLLKNNDIEKDFIVEIGKIRIDKIKRSVLFDKNNIDLVKKEFELLVLLAESPDKVFSRDEILNKVWGYDVFPTTRTVDTHILQLRQKLDESLIQTVRSVGYKLTVL